jgi:formamidase
VELRFDTRVPLVKDTANGHNRWHPSIPPVAQLHDGEELLVDTRDGIDAQIAPGEIDLAQLDLRRGHPLTGPFHVEGAQPGDLLEVTIEEIDPARFGFTLVRPGAGPLGDIVERPFLVHWEIEGGPASSAGWARSPQLPGVRVAGSPFVGVLGVAPSQERLALFARREAELLARGGAVRPPERQGAVPPEGVAADEGLRTVPPRETGGNLDIKQLGAGSVLLLTVDVPGALLSLGDVHFAQGDGEVCSQAIEIAATVRLRVRLRRGSDLRWRPRNPFVSYSEQPAARARRYLFTTGIPVDEHGANHDRDLGVAARGALLEMVGYLQAVRGLGFEQAYALCSVAVDLRISEMVNTPNVLVSAALPLDVFEDEDDGFGPLGDIGPARVRGERDLEVRT